MHEQTIKMLIVAGFFISLPYSYSPFLFSFFRSRRFESEDDGGFDAYYNWRRYRFPSEYNYLAYAPYDLDCGPCCDLDLGPYSGRRLGCCGTSPPSSRYWRDPHYSLCHSRSGCAVCRKYGLYQPLFSRRFFYPNLFPSLRRPPSRGGGGGIEFESDEDEVPRRPR